MMRAPHFIAVAVRKPDQGITIKTYPFIALTQRYPILGKPVLRGVITLFESMIQGMQALSYSANVAAMAEDGKVEGKEQEKLSSFAIAVSITSAVALGLGLFVALPHLLTAWTTSQKVTADSPWFHLVDGMFKMTILVLYVYLIAFMKDIRRVFQYHGAEHKSIYTFEAGEDLTVANARKHSTLHPRCGTSFLLFLVLISIAVFSIVFPVFGLTRFSSIPLLNHTIMVFVKIVLMLPVAGLSYEFIKGCAVRMNNWIFRAMIWPGMVLQKLTTREPEDDQLEVALASLRQVLRLEKGLDSDKKEGEFQFAALDLIPFVAAGVSEFPEV